MAAGIDIIPDKKNLGAKRQKRGECPTCGAQTHKVSMFGQKKPLTIEGRVYKGRCLVCHPIEGYTRRPPPNPQQQQQQENQMYIPRTLEVDNDDDMGSIVSGITMDHRLIQGARNWNPSQGVEYDSDEDEGGAALPPPQRRPDASVGGDDPYADSRPDPEHRPLRTMPTYTQSMRNLGVEQQPGMRSSSRDFAGLPPSGRKPPPGPPHSRFQQNNQHLLGKSEGSLSSADMHDQRGNALHTYQHNDAGPSESNYPAGGYGNGFPNHHHNNNNTEYGYGEEPNPGPHPDSYEYDNYKLFNLREDLAEKNDLAREMPEKAKQLHTELMAWVKDTAAPIPTKPNPRFSP